MSYWAFDRPYEKSRRWLVRSRHWQLTMLRRTQKCRWISAARALLDCGCKRSRSVGDTTNDTTASPCAWAMASTAVAATRGIGLIQMTRADPARDRNAARRADRPGVR